MNLTMHRGAWVGMVIASVLLLACDDERVTVGYLPESRRVDAANAGRTATAMDAGMRVAPSDAMSATGPDEDPPGCKWAFSSEVTSDVVGSSSDPVGIQYAPVTFFNGGEPLPAGRYRVEYVDGCFICCITLLDSFFLVQDDRAPIAVLPGGSSVGIEGPSVGQCPVRRAPFAPLELDFVGGKLGVWLSDAVAADNVNGDSRGSRSPTWRLTRLDACP